jgi:hypothetical protein
MVLRAAACDEGVAMERRMRNARRRSDVALAAFMGGNPSRIGANRGARGPRHRVRLESKFGDDVTHVRNLRIGGVGFHDD